MNKKIVGALVAIFVLIIGGYYYASPYLVLNSIKGAAQAGDSEKVSAYIDYPSVRQSFKDQMNAYMVKGMASKETDGWEALGAMIATTMVDKIVDAAVTPEGMTLMLQGKDFGDSLKPMLSSAIKGYQNKVLTAAQVIDELIKLAKAIQESDKLAQELNLTEYEYAFYSAVAENDSARELMQKEILRELAVVLTKSIRENVTLDWTIKEAARAKLRVIVKRLLKKYGYPPDMALLATETVLEQAELLAEGFAEAA